MIDNRTIDVYLHVAKSLLFKLKRGFQCSVYNNNITHSICKFNGFKTSLSILILTIHYYECRLHHQALMFSTDVVHCKAVKGLSSCVEGSNSSFGWISSTIIWKERNSLILVHLKSIRRFACRI